MQLFGNVESLRMSALEAEDGSSLGVGEGMAERGVEQNLLPRCSPAKWVRI